MSGEKQQKMIAFLCFLKGEYLMLPSDMVGTGPANHSSLEVSGGRCAPFDGSRHHDTPAARAPAARLVVHPAESFDISLARPYLFFPLLA